MEEIKNEKIERILIISENYPTYLQKRGGVFALDELNFFENQGYLCYLTILYRKTLEKRHILKPYSKIKETQDHINSIKKEVKNRPNCELITYYSLPKPFVFNEACFIAANSSFRDYSIHTVFVHSTLHAGLTIKWIKKQFPKALVILKQHSNINLYHPLVRMLYIRTLHNYDYIACNSNKSKEELKESVKNLEQNKLVVEYPKFKINNSPVIKSNKKHIKFCTVANLIKEKGFYESISLIEYIDNKGVDWSWVIIGKGNLRASLEKEFNNRRWDNVIFIEEVNKINLYKILEESNVYLQLSYKETFGIAPLEAYSYQNKLIISNEITSVNELLVDEDNIYKCDLLNLRSYLDSKLLAFLYQTYNHEIYRRNVDNMKQKIFTRYSNSESFEYE